MRTGIRLRTVAARWVGRLSCLCAAAAVTAVMWPASAAPAAPGGRGGYATALQYVVRFYPRWFSYVQAQHIPANRLVAPAHMSPVFGEVVAPNDDTLYASSFMYLSAQPVILTIPPTAVTYSVLSMNAYGSVFQTSVTGGAPGRYALTGPGWRGTLPPGVTRVRVPDSFSIWIIRADKYSASGVNQLVQAERFRASLRAQTLSAYRADPSGGATRIVPVALYALRYKVLADQMIMRAPIAFLRQLQTAVHAASTPPLAGAGLRLSNRFDRLFGSGHFRSRAARASFARAAQAAHRLIVARYHAHTGPTRWVSFTDIGAWGRHYLNRAATTEYLQYSNTHSTAAYYHAFTDGGGTPLNAATHGYVLTFGKAQLPRAQRFWSVTAYLPSSVTLVRNPARKYVVASYTPGLHTGRDGSVSVYLAAARPAGIAMANWLPVPAGRFNVVLRVYGPEGSVADGTYVPPAISPLR